MIAITLIPLPQKRLIPHWSKQGKGIFQAGEIIIVFTEIFEGNPKIYGLIKEQSFVAIINNPSTSKPLDLIYWHNIMYASRENIYKY